MKPLILFYDFSKGMRQNWLDVSSIQKGKLSNCEREKGAFSDFVTYEKNESWKEMPTDGGMY